MSNYLLIGIIFIGIIVIGIFYSFASDTVSFFDTAFSTSPLSSYTDEQTEEGGDILEMVLDYILIPVLVCFILFTFGMIQKPEQRG